MSKQVITRADGLVEVKLEDGTMRLITIEEYQANVARTDEYKRQQREAGAVVVGDDDIVVSTGYLSQDKAGNPLSLADK